MGRGLPRSLAVCLYKATNESKENFLPLPMPNSLLGEVKWKLPGSLLSSGLSVSLKVGAGGILWKASML